MQPCQALITSPDVLNKILPDKPGAVHIGLYWVDLTGRCSTTDQPQRPGLSGSGVNERF